MRLLDGKAAIITGAASGLGKAAAGVFSGHGAKLVLADVNPGGASVAEEICSSGGDAAFILVDITREHDVAAMVGLAVERYGRLDCALNNAGINAAPTPLHETRLAAWSEVVSVDLTGTFLCLKYEIARMRQVGGGAIVNVASAGGLVGFSTAPVAPYVAAKHGVVGLTKQAALENAEWNIRVNAICPGLMATEMANAVVASGQLTVEQMVANQAIKVLADPADVAQTAAWLLSDYSSFTTGHAMAVDGGWVAD